MVPSKKSHKARLSFQMDVIDLTSDDAREPVFIDLTKEPDSPPPRSKSQASSLTNSHREVDTRQSTGTKRRQRKRKPETNDAQPSRLVEPDTSGSKSLLERIERLPSEANQASNTTQKSDSKRESGENVDSRAPARAEARPPPLGRHKSQHSPPISSNDKSSPLRQPETSGKVEDMVQRAYVDGQALSTSPPEEPTDLFYVDTVPNLENKHIEDVPKSAYRIDAGNLLLPHHVLLESAEEALQTPGSEVYPPPTPGHGEESIDIVDDSILVSFLQP